jgi:hypothetical protein
MADYYPLVSKAVAGLHPNALGEARRVIYERARAALSTQLRSVQPPLSESEIVRERLSLEEAVGKVESEAAERARAFFFNTRTGNEFRTQKLSEEDFFAQIEADQKRMKEAEQLEILTETHRTALTELEAMRSKKRAELEDAVGRSNAQTK